MLKCYSTSLFGSQMAGYATLKKKRKRHLLLGKLGEADLDLWCGAGTERFRLGVVFAGGWV